MTNSVQIEDQPQSEVIQGIPVDDRVLTKADMIKAKEKIAMEEESKSAVMDG